MPIEFDNSRVDVRDVDDRRGRGIGGGGLAIGGGAGVVGLVIALVVALMGGNGSALQLPTTSGAAASGQPAESTSELQARCNSAGALEQYADCRLIKVFNVADDVWSEEFARRGVPYATPRFAFFTGSTTTGCGRAQAQVGPFYCPPDQEIFFELGFLQQLQDQFGAQGEFAHPRASTAPARSRAPPMVSLRRMSATRLASGHEPRPNSRIGRWGVVRRCASVIEGLPA